MLVLRGFALMRRVPFVTVPGFLLLVACTVYRALLGHLVSHPVASVSLGPPLSLGAGATVRGKLDASRQRGELPDQPPRWVPACLVVWVISAAAGYWVHAGIPALNSIVLAFLLYAAAGKLRLTRGYSRTVRQAQPSCGWPGR